MCYTGILSLQNGDVATTLITTKFLKLLRTKFLKLLTTKFLKLLTTKFLKLLLIIINYN